MRGKGKAKSKSRVQPKKQPLVGHKMPGRPSVHKDTAVIPKRDEEPKPWVNLYMRGKGL